MTALIGWLLYLTVFAVGLTAGKPPRDPYFTDTILRWRRDARIFVRECIGATPDKWQDEALRLVSDPKTRRLAFKACKGPGKTATLAWIILWFLACHVDSKVGCTSVTEANIDSNLWPELYRWLNMSAYLKGTFTWSKSRVERRGNPNWFAVKRTWPKSGDSQQQADALAGLHADNIMFVLDESGGIPQAVMVTAEAVLANYTEAAEAMGFRALVVQSGNPTHTTGPLYRACTVEKHLWAVISITGDPEDPMRSPRIDIKWASEQIQLWGRDNPWVMVNVLGMFPPSSINSLLGVEEVEAAMKRHIPVDAYAHGQKRLGVDVARFGDDRTVIFPRWGQVAFRPDIIRQQNTSTIAGRVARAVRMFKPEITLIDDTGHWGHGVIDQLQTAQIACVPVIFHAAPYDKRYGTTRDLMWMMMADWVKKGGALPNMPELVPELTEITYTFIGGKFVVEAKDMLKKRIGVSPDMADALATTFALPEMPGAMMDALGGNRNETVHDFDPFAEAQQTQDRQLARMLHDFDPLA